MRSSKPAVALTERDRAIIRTAYSLGLVSSSGLRAVVSPGTGRDTFAARLRLLTGAGHLTRTAVIAGLARTYLYGVGPRALQPGAPRPWRPSVAQLDHTLGVERALLAMLRPGFATPVCVTGWEGESEIRAWAPPGAAFPDLRVRWRAGGAGGCWDVEVDRATESRAALRRKFARYLVLPNGNVVLVLTTSAHRARNIARIASEIGAPVLVTTSAAIAEQQDPDVLDSIRRCRTRLSVATQAIATESIS